METTLAAVGFAVLGYVIRTAWDSYIRNRDELRMERWKIKTHELEQRLSQFYWPVYLRLQRDNVVWKRILERSNSDDENRSKLAYEVEKAILIPNHQEIERVVYANIHLADSDHEFEQALLAYLRHIDIYTSIRAIDINDKDPVDFEEPFPTNFFHIVEERLKSYQNQYDRLLLEEAGFGDSSN